MSVLNSSDRAKLFNYRSLLDKVEAAIPKGNESEFNASAAVINDNAAAIRVWIAGTADNPRTYERSELRVDPTDGIPYWAMHTHSSYAGQELQPSKTPSIWAHCHGTTPKTARPFIAEGHNPYMTGHYCTEDGAVYRCNRDNVVHAPSILPDAWESLE